MKKEYREWIDKYVDQEAPGLCREVCLCMINAFPELRAVWGEYRVNNDIVGHAWCVDDSEQEIVDPTAFQFEEGGEYDELHELLDATEYDVEVAIYKAKKIFPDALDYGELSECNSYWAMRTLAILEENLPPQRLRPRMVVVSGGKGDQ
jgi:hypothetical protein